MNVTVELDIDADDVDQDDPSGLTEEAFDRLHVALSEAGFTVQDTFLNGDLSEPDTTKEYTNG